MYGVCWNNLCSNPNIPQEFYDENIQHINYSILHKIIRKNEIITFDWYHNDSNMKILLSHYTLERILGFLTSRKDMTENFVLKYIDNFTELQWSKILTKSTLSYSFFLSIKSKIPTNAWNRTFVLYDPNFKEMNKLLMEIL